MPTITTVDATWDTGVTMDAAELRRADSAMFLGDGTNNGVRGGVVRHGDTSLAVTVNGSDQVTVQAGAFVVPAATGLGVYRGSLAAATSAVNLSARNGTNPRIDLIVIQVTGTAAVVKTIDGTPGSSPSPPALPAQHIEIARATVPQTGGGAVIVDSTWRSYATGLGGDLFVELASRLPGSGNQKGQRAVALDSGLAYTWSGTDWALSRSPGGTLGYAQVVAVQTGLNSSGANVTGLSVTVTIPASRRIRISAIALVRQLTADGVIALEVFEGATKLQRALGTTVTNSFATLAPTLVLTPTAGSHTYNLKMATTAGTANVEAATDSPAYILVEDIGSV